MALGEKLVAETAELSFANAEQLQLSPARVNDELSVRFARNGVLLAALWSPDE